MNNSDRVLYLLFIDDKLTVGSANKIVAMTPKKLDTAAIGMEMSIAKPEAVLH